MLPNIVIVDVRNGAVYTDGTNINVPEEGREALLRAIETAEILIEINVEGVWVKQGVVPGGVTLIATKSEPQMSAEKAQREATARNKGPEVTTGMKGDRATYPDDPVDVKFRRVWQDIADQL
jgi:hypothetical protein